MARANIGQLVAEAWDECIRESPDPFSGPHMWFEEYGGKRYNYRQTLDWQPVNSYGELIPRIVTVRRNMLVYGTPRLNPTRLPE